MKIKELSKGEIAQIIEFVRSKYVRYQDVQFELVDHLATNVEEQLAADANLTFESALKLAYAEFPKTGFSKFVQFKTIALKKYWRARFFSFLKGYFKLPKILLLLAMFSVSYLFLISFPSYVKNFGSTLIVVIYIGHFIGLRSYQKAMKVKALLLVEESYYGMVQWFLFIPMSLFISVFFNGMNSHWDILILSIVFPLIMVTFYGMLSVFPEQLRQEMEAKYKHLVPHHP